MEPGDNVLVAYGAKDGTVASDGRHAMVAVGHDDAKRAFLVQNSVGQG